MRNPICLLLTIWLTIKTGAWLQGRWVSGHSYVIEEPAPANVQVLKCELCGHYDITWCKPEAITPQWMAAKGQQYVGPMTMAPLNAQSGTHKVCAGGFSPRKRYFVPDDSGEKPDSSDG